jgi:hypothetical protein
VKEWWCVWGGAGRAGRTGQLTDATIKRVTAGLDAHALRDRYTQRVAAQEEFALNLKKKQLALKVGHVAGVSHSCPHPRRAGGGRNPQQRDAAGHGDHAQHTAGCRTITVS